MAQDYYNIKDLLREEHLLVKQAVKRWVNEHVKPDIEAFAQKSECPYHLIKPLGELGAFGASIPIEYGGGGMDEISYGIIMQELEKGDSGIRSMASVQSSLVMYPIYQYGSEEQKLKYLPKLGSGDMVGCFGLTEPNHGSDPSNMETSFTFDGDDIILNGSKMWITNSPIADIAVVWAKDTEGKVRGLIVEKGLEGFTAPEIKNKWSLRASITGELVFDQLRLPKTSILPGVKGMKGPLSCLNKARFGIAWGAIGAAIDCYETALQYASERKQFGKKLVQFQLVQKKLAEMITEITKAQLLAWRLGCLANEGKATPSQISMAKRNNVAMALNIAREARQILGAMGIVGDYPIMRHMMNLESVITYEGTHDIHLLITGMDVTGENAFV